MCKNILITTQKGSSKKVYNIAPTIPTEKKLAHLPMTCSVNNLDDKPLVCELATIISVFAQ